MSAVKIIAALVFAFFALVALDFWTSHRAGLDGAKTSTLFAFPLLVAMAVGAFLTAAVSGAAQP